MNHGPGWILYEQTYPELGCKLLSILGPRRTPRDVAAFMEQLYIDRFGSIEEKLAYKKSRKHGACPANINHYGYSVYCGNGTTFFALYSHKIILCGSELKLEYRIVIDGSNPLDLKWENKELSLTVDA